MVNQVSQVHLETEVSQVRMELLVYRVCQEHRALRDLQVHLVYQDIKDLQVNKETLGFLVLKDQEDTEDHQVPLERLEHLDLLEGRDHRV